MPAATRPGPAPASNPKLGIALMTAGMFTFAMVDTMAKYLTDTLHPMQIVWSRQMGLVAGLVVILCFRGFSVLRTKAPGLQILRGAVASLSASLFVFAVAYVPLADAVAVTFVAPFMVTLMAAVVLREPVGIRRWIAVAIGFVGALIVIRPGMGVMHPAVALVVLASFFFAIRQIVSRALADSDRTVTTVAYTALVSVAILTLPLPFVWQTPDAATLRLLIVMALVAAAAETMVIMAFQKALAVSLAPIHYTILIWSTFYGWLIFADLPDMFTWAGAAIIMGTGLYTIHRERVVARRRAAAK